MPDDSALPDEIKDAIDRLIDSLPGLEFLMLAYREPDRGWTASELARPLGTSEKTVEALLAQMRKRGLLTGDPAQPHFDARTPLYAQVEIIARAYGARRIELINYVASGALRRVRALSDAFRLKPRKTDEGGDKS